MQEHQHDAGVGQQQRQPLAAVDTLFQEDGRDQQHKGRRQEQDQAFQSDRDVLQAEEIEKARQVVADQAEAQHAPAVGRRQRRRTAHLPQRDGAEHGQREQHAEGDQRDGVDVITVQQLGHHGLGGKQHGAADRDQQAAQIGRPRAR